MHNSRRIPETRDQVLALLDAVNWSLDQLHLDQIVAFRRLYRLNDDRPVSVLVRSGEICETGPADVLIRILGCIRAGKPTSRADLLKVQQLIRYLSPSEKISLRNEISLLISESWLLQFLFTSEDDRLSVSVGMQL